MLRLKEEHVPNQAKDVADALARRHEMFHTVGELNQADAIIVAGGTKRKDGRQFRCDFFFLLKLCAKELAAAAIDDQQHSQFAFLDEAFDEGIRPVSECHCIAKQLCKMFLKDGELLLSIASAAVFGKCQNIVRQMRAAINIVIARDAECRSVFHHRHCQSKNVRYLRTAINQVTHENELAPIRWRDAVFSAIPFDRITQLLYQRG